MRACVAEGVEWACNDKEEEELRGQLTMIRVPKAPS